jgi:hypothetical protein
MDAFTYNGTLAFILFSVGYWYTVKEMFKFPDEREDNEL